jgi:hypothetical protein
MRYDSELKHIQSRFVPSYSLCVFIIFFPEISKHTGQVQVWITQTEVTFSYKTDHSIILVPVSAWKQYAFAATVYKPDWRTNKISSDDTSYVCAALKAHECDYQKQMTTTVKKFRYDKFQTNSGTHQASFRIGIEGLFSVLSGRRVKLTTHCCLVPRLRMSEVMNTFPHMPPWRVQRFPFLFTSITQFSLPNVIHVDVCKNFQETVSVPCRSYGNSLPPREKELMLRHNPVWLNDARQTGN